MSPLPSLAINLRQRSTSILTNVVRYSNYQRPTLYNKSLMCIGQLTDDELQGLIQHSIELKQTFKVKGFMFLFFVVLFLLFF